MILKKSIGSFCLFFLFFFLFFFAFFSFFFCFLSTELLSELDELEEELLSEELLLLGGWLWTKSIICLYSSSAPLNCLM